MKHYTAFGKTVTAARVVAVAPVLDRKTIFLLILEGEPYPIQVRGGSSWRPGCYYVRGENYYTSATETFFKLFYKEVVELNEVM